jgi:hypothetical protein
VYSQRSAQQDKALAYLRERGEVYIRIDESANDLTQVGSNLTLDHKTEGNYRYAYVNRGQFNYLRNANISYEVLTPPSLERTVRMAIKKNDLVTWDSYPTYPP